MTISRTLIVLFARSMLGLALLAAGAPGQNILMSSSSQRNPMTPVNPEGADYSSLSRQNEPSFSEYAAGGLIDNSIDEETYFVGGGDVFLISILDRSTKIIYATINQGGDLYIPLMGTVPVGKKNLRETREIIKEYFKERVKKVEDLYVTLHRVKTATVTVTGALVNPGTFELPGTMRLWDAVREACWHFKEKRVEEVMQQNDLRSVKRRNRDSIDYFDLFAFVYQNDVTQNPYVYPGDEIQVSPITDRVFVHGAISGPVTGWIPLRADDRAGRLLSLFYYSANADTAHMTLYRRTFGENGAVGMEKFAVTLGSDLRLQNDDIITVSPKSNIFEQLITSVEGEVARPGTYPIVKSGTTAKELIAMAGDQTPYANMKKAAIIRRSRFSMSSPIISTDNVVEFGEPINKVRPELGSALGLMTTTKDFSVIRIEDHPDVILEPGDQLIVPPAEKMVYLSGNIEVPGGYPYVPGKSKKYYIKQAGGLTKQADRSNIYLVAQYGEARQVFNRDIVEDGDLIVVPLSVEYKKLTTIVLPILGATISTLGLLVGLFATLK
jgi:polysaccharide export outer membrane protein